GWEHHTAGRPARYPPVETLAR
ncbi:MAG: hypothetical protein QOC75_3565, partial [Pseudonocardiales bacterium]|nr:hypothetical protein [Pseudonocardiales bacterium]